MAGDDGDTFVNRLTPNTLASLRVFDLGVAVLVGGSLLFADSRMAGGPSGQIATSVRGAAVVIAAAMVAARRIRPQAAFIGAVVATGTAVALGGAPQASFCVAFTAFTAATAKDYIPEWAPPALASAALAASVLTGQSSGLVPALLATIAIVSGGWFAGQAARERHKRLVGLAERHAESERQHAAELRQAAVDERLVIARELHDIVAHSMSVITVRAGVARVVMDADPSEAKEALSIIETTSRQALSEMRLLVEVLRQEQAIDEVLSPAPGLREITMLVEQICRAGVGVDLDVQGAVRALPAGVDLSAYRIAQEALTNVVRHAGPTEARLLIRYRPDDLLIQVTDSGPNVERSVDHTDTKGAGHGLIGMGERVALFNGTLRTGPHGNGYQVHAVLRTDGPLA